MTITIDHEVLNEDFIKITSDGGKIGRIQWTNSNTIYDFFGKISWRKILGRIWQSENQMRAMECPHIDNLNDLKEYIEFLVEREHDYGTCVYAMSLAAEATYNYVAGNLGVTGFQASCADLDLIRRTRRIKGPFIILKAEDELYPQYNNINRYYKFIDDASEWLKETAQEKINEKCSWGPPHPDVMQRLQQWANITLPENN